MSHITTPWGKKLYASIFTGTLTPSQIAAICRVTAKEAQGVTHEVGSMDARKSQDLNVLTDAIQTIEPLCIPSHRDSGLKLLHQLAYTPNGHRRRTKWSDQFEEPDLVVLAKATAIAFTDIHIVFGSYNRVSADPEFEVRSDNGHFKYYYRSWQSGGGFEISSR